MWLIRLLIGLRSTEKLNNKKLRPTRIEGLPYVTGSNKPPRKTIPPLNTTWDCAICKDMGFKKMSWRQKVCFRKALKQGYEEAKKYL